MNYASYDEMMPKISQNSVFKDRICREMKKQNKMKVSMGENDTCLKDDRSLDHI